MRRIDITEIIEYFQILFFFIPRTELRTSRHLRFVLEKMLAFLRGALNIKWRMWLASAVANAVRYFRGGKR